MQEQLKSKAKFLIASGLNSGLSLINQIASNFNDTNHDDSEEEVGQITENDVYIQRGDRGVIVFATTSLTSGKRKVLHINLQKQQFISYHDNTKRIHNCSDIMNVYKVTEYQVNLEVRTAKTKKLLFEKEGMADRFTQYLEIINEQGSGIRQAFKEIDIYKQGRIHAENLSKALNKVDLFVPREEVETMMNYALQANPVIDYHAFFHLFLDNSSYIDSLHDALQEWLALARYTESATGSSSMSSTKELLTSYLQLLPGEMITFLPPERVHWALCPAPLPRQSSSSSSSGGGTNSGTTATGMAMNDSGNNSANSTSATSSSTSYAAPSTCAKPYIHSAGRLVLTNYRLVLLSLRPKSSPSSQSSSSSSSNRYDIPAYFQCMTLPLATIYTFRYGQSSHSQMHTTNFASLAASIAGSVPHSVGGGGSGGVVASGHNSSSSLQVGGSITAAPGTTSGTATDTEATSVGAIANSSSSHGHGPSVSSTSNGPFIQQLVAGIGGSGSSSSGGGSNGSNIRGSLYLYGKDYRCLVIRCSTSSCLETYLSFLQQSLPTSGEGSSSYGGGFFTAAFRQAMNQLPVQVTTTTTTSAANNNYSVKITAKIALPSPGKKESSSLQALSLTATGTKQQDQPSAIAQQLQQQQQQELLLEDDEYTMVSPPPPPPPPVTPATPATAAAVSTSSTSSQQILSGEEYHTAIWSRTSDILKEYERQGLLSSLAKQRYQILANANPFTSTSQAAFNTLSGVSSRWDVPIAKGYPAHLVVPRLMSLEQIVHAAGYRSQGRLPVVTYLHDRARYSRSGSSSAGDEPGSGPVLIRSAQPMPGVMMKLCPEDILLLDHYRTKGLGSSHSYGSNGSGSSHGGSSHGGQQGGGSSNSSSGRRPSVASSMEHVADNNHLRSNRAASDAPSHPPHHHAQHHHAQHQHAQHQHHATAAIAAAATAQQAYYTTHSEKLFILDLRSQLAATLNRAAGKGTERIESYPNCSLLFGNIDNIHEVRSATNAYIGGLSQHYTHFHPFTSAQGIMDILYGQNNLTNNYESTVYPMVGQGQEPGWLRYLRQILMNSVYVAEKLHVESCSVLVHCSDGWDRTAQVCSLSQILLDPYFRTIDGLARLIEKEWCAFGHKFQDRCGHGYDIAYLPDERCPVFLQFLDCLYQLLVQFPRAFQYNEDLLLFLANHVHSGLFGNFLANNEQDRQQQQQYETTVSIWAYIQLYPERFVNASYLASYVQPIWPMLEMSQMKVWSRYWLRWDMHAHPHALLSDQPAWQEDWGEQAAQNWKEYETLASLTNGGNNK